MESSRSWLWLVLVLVSGWLVWLLAPVITPFAIAATIAYLTDPMVDRIERVSVGSWQAKRTLAVTAVFLLLTVLMAVALLVAVPLLLRQARELTQQIPEWIDWVTGTAWPWLEQSLGIPALEWDPETAKNLFREYWQEVSGAAVDVLGTLGRGGKAVVTVATNLVLVPVVAFYLMRDWDKLLAGVQNLLPRKRVTAVSGVAREIDEVLSAFLRGQLMVMLALGLVYSAGLWLIGLQAAFLIGMLAGLLSIVPYLGSIIGLALALGVAVFQFGDVLHLALVLLVFGVGQSLEGMVLTPNLVGDKIGLHPVAVIFAVLAGGQLFGFLGILLALPAAAALNVVLRHIQDIYRHSAWYTNE